MQHHKSSGWHPTLVISHPDEIRPGTISSGWHMVQLTLCHPGDLGKLLRVSSGWHSTLTISLPDEILPIAKSFGWLRVQISLCHLDDIGHLVIIHPDAILPIAYDIGTRSHPRSPHYGRFVGESTRYAALWDWYCFVVRLNKLLINQSIRQWVQKLWLSCDVTVMS